MTNSNRKRRANKVKTLEEIFQEINRRHVRIKKKDRKHNNTILNEVLEELLQIMRKCDSLFDSMKPKPEYLGSYFDGLRVGAPTEYDINVILTIHINYNNIILNAHEIRNGYTSIIMPEEFHRLSKTPATAVKGFSKTECWCDRSYRLLITKFRSWMQSVVDAALHNLPSEGGKRILKLNDKYYKILFTTSGPANTITICMENDEVIDVDLVPTLAFKLPKIPSHSKIDFHKVKITNISYYFAVPKPSENDFSWRLAFPYHERYYIYNKNNLKLLKLFRDIQGFNKLASYFIKTIFLWEIIEKQDEFWKKSSLTTLVIHMLNKLRDCLATATIKNFWCPDHNLLEKIKNETCQNWSNRVTNILNDIERNKLVNPYVVLKYFTKQKSISK